MPNLRGKTWTTTTPAYVEDAQYWENHLISDAAAAKAASSVQSVNSQTPDANGNVDIVALPSGGTAGQVLTKQSSTAGDADWADPASSGHTIQNPSGTDMTYRENLQFLNAEVTDDSANDRTIVDCKGEKGDPGQAATITIGTTTTLPAGSSATVTNTGTSSAAVFNFGIPSGGAEIDDTTTSTTKVWSSQKVSTELSTKLSYADNGVLGAKNLLPNTATSQTVNGVTFTINTDGTVTVSTGSGGATANTALAVNQTLTEQIVPKGQYILSSGVTGSNAYLLASAYNGNTWVKNFGDTQSGDLSMDVDYLGYDIIRVYLTVKSGSVYTTSATVKPMIRLATDTDDTYVPYAMTNKELTSELSTGNTSVSGKGVALSLTRWGNVCQATWGGKLTEAVAADATILTLPVGYRPKITTVAITTNKPASVNDRANYTLSTDGTVSPNGYNLALNDALRGCCTYIIGG